jgi:cytochrome c biogenesis protein CcmG, thiol:disulfide interchange protein DsbE
MSDHTRSRTQGGWFWWAVGGFAVLVIAGVIAVASSSGSSDEAKVEVADRVTVQGRSLPSLPTDPAKDPAVGTAAPTLSGVTFNGDPVEITYDGRPHLLVFVAHWCPHCQAEVPRIVELVGEEKDAGVAMTAIATGTDAGAPNYPPSAWLRRERWRFPVLVDTDQSRAAKAYGLTSYPFLVFVDAQGNVAARVSGEVPKSALASMLDALAAGQPVPIPGSGAASSS